MLSSINLLVVRPFMRHYTRRDRALVNRIQSNNREDIQKLIELVWKDDKSNDADLGRAAERTIARLDRVGFFLLGKGDNPRTDSLNGYGH
jgi:hypothetical protein